MAGKKTYNTQHSNVKAEYRSNYEVFVVNIVQTLFWVCAQPMRDGITK